MDSTVFIAQLLGFFFLITGASMVFRREMMIAIFNKLFTERIFSYLLGVLLLILGLVIVLLHTTWIDRLDVIVSIVGWYMILEAIAYLFISKSLMAGTLQLIKEKKYYYIVTAPYICIGIVLLIFAFI